MPLNMVKREEWGAVPAKHQDPLHTPIKYVAWTFTASDTCHSRAECAELLRFLQGCQMSKKELADIRWNFLISSDGTIYEGRGWLSNVSRYDQKNKEIIEGRYITIARIGMDYDETPATPVEIAAREEIIRYGIENNYLIPEWAEAPYFHWLSF